MNEVDSLSSLIGRLAGALGHGAGVLSGADIAMIKRMNPREINAPGFFKLAGTLLKDSLGSGSNEAVETRWAAIMVALAHLGELHKPATRLGHALVAAGYSEARFVRLLRSDDDRLIDEIPSLGRFLSARMTSADFTDAARLILSYGRTDAEGTRRRIARDFYSAISQHEATHS